MKLKGLKILLVDDEPDLCHLLSWEFEDVGMIVTKSNSATDAIKNLKKNQFDIVLSDVKMPDGDGIELLEFIYKEKITLKAIYLMTGYSDYPVKNLIDIGLTKLFKKPLEVEEFLSDVEALD